MPEQDHLTRFHKSWHPTDVIISHPTTFLFHLSLEDSTTDKSSKINPLMWKCLSSRTSITSSWESSTPWTDWIFYLVSLSKNTWDENFITHNFELSLRYTTVDDMVKNPPFNTKQGKESDPWLHDFTCSYDQSNNSKRGLIIWTKILNWLHLHSICIVALLFEPRSWINCT